MQFRQDRLTICKSCEEYNKNYRTCNVCGCFIPLKTSIPISACPLKKWREVNWEDNKGKTE